MLSFLAQRDRQPELMDQPGLDGDEHRRALNGLRTTNSISRTASVLWRAILTANIVADNQRPLRVLDVAAGGGDVITVIRQLAENDGVAIEAHGCDINATAIDHARATAARAYCPDVSFFQFNALADTLPETYDVIICTLFLHHLGCDDAQQLLRRMAQAAQKCVLVDDLIRTRLGYAYASVGGRLITRSRIVHTDGPLSVRAAFTIPEARQIAVDAGLPNAHFRRHWPERFLMTWKKHE